jgi:hypothetical protein
MKTRFWNLLLGLALASPSAGCSSGDGGDPSDDDASEEPGDDDASVSGDDDASLPGDDDTGSGDDDVTADTPTPTAPPTPTPAPTPTPMPGDNDGDGVLNLDDCDDLDAATFPGAPELCDARDNDCDGEIDESMYAGTQAVAGCGIHLMFPGYGAMAAPTALTVSIDFDSTLYAKPEWIEGHITGDDGSVVQLSAATPDKEIPTRVVFEPVGTKAGVTYTLVVTAAENGTFVAPYAGWVVKGRASFTHDPPCGVTFNTSNSMKIVKLGATSAPVLSSINANIASSKTQLGLVFPGMTSSQTFPVQGFDVMLGAMTSVSKTSFTVDVEYGFPTRLTGNQIDESGEFATRKADVVLLVPVSDTLGLMYTRDAVMTGHVDQSGDFRFFTDFKTTGYVTQADMHKMLVAAGQSSLESNIKMDMDTNDDGVADAATLEISSSPSISTLLECQ